MANKKREDGRNSRTVANNKYNNKAYDKLTIMVKKGQRDIIKEYAAAQGESMGSLINRLLDAEIENFSPIGK